MARRSFMNQASYAAARQLQQGSYSGKAGDLLSHTLFDTIPFAQIGQTNRFFSSPVGASTVSAGAATTKDNTWTNMLDSGKLPAGQKFLIKSVRPELVLVGPAATVQAIGVYQAFLRVMQATTFRIVLPGRDFDWESPASVFLAPAPLAIKEATGNTDTVNHLYFGAPKIGLETPIAIGDVDGAPVTFSFQAIVATADANVQAALTILGTTATEARLRVALLGNLVRLK